MSGKVRRAIGLMSGTSLDGIDVAFLETDGHTRVTAALRARLRSVLGGQGPVAEVERDLTDAHAAAVEGFLVRHHVGPVDVVGMHGHTILHRPQEGPHLADRRRRAPRPHASAGSSPAAAGAIPR